MKGMLQRIIAAGVFLFASSSAFAAIVSVTGAGIIKTAGTDITSTADNAYTDTNQWGFDEQQGVLLGAALSVDSGGIAAGTRIDSHMIFLDRGGFASSPTITTDATWTFSGNILGVMSDINGHLEKISNELLGATGVTYPCYGSSGDCFANRGMEFNDSYGISGNTLRVHMVVTSPGDWIRVVTAGPTPVPEPSTVALFGVGMALLGFVGLRRRRS